MQKNNAEKDKPKSQINMRELFMIPNLICLFRILCIPVFVPLCVFAGINSDLNLVWAALAVFIVASASDIVDGKVARKYNMVSGLGMMLDPLADKLMHVSVLLCLSFALQYIHWVFVALIMLKELLMIVLSIVFAGKGVTIKANMLGKVGSVGLSCGVILSFFTGLAGETKFENPVYTTVAVILGIACVINYAAAINYLVQILKQIKKMKADSVNADDGILETAKTAE